MFRFPAKESLYISACKFTIHKAMKMNVILFVQTETASWCATVILSFVLIGVGFFGLVFFRKIVKHQYQLSDQKYQQLEEMKRQLDVSSTILNI